jgi:hypothetical protein
MIKERKTRLVEYTGSFKRATHQCNGFDSENSLETVPNKWKYGVKLYVFVVTYKAGTAGDIPVAEVLIKGICF